MKLLFCRFCKDLFKLNYEIKYCKCGKCWGYYEPDGINAVISDQSYPVGIHNQEFINAISNQPKTGTGYSFKAFVIPKHCPTIKTSNHEEK
jgi:hypothetical protein